MGGGDNNNGDTRGSDRNIASSACARLPSQRLLMPLYRGSAAYSRPSRTMMLRYINECCGHRVSRRVTPAPNRARRVDRAKPWVIHGPFNALPVTLTLCPFWRPGAQPAVPIRGGSRLPNVLSTPYRQHLPCALFGDLGHSLRYQFVVVAGFGVSISVIGLEGRVVLARCRVSRPTLSDCTISRALS